MLYQAPVFTLILDITSGQNVSKKVAGMSSFADIQELSTLRAPTKLFK